MSKNILFLILVVGVFVAAGLMAGLAFSASRHSRIVVDWETASELNTAGFNIYRGETRDQIETRLNAQLLPPATDPLRGQAYKFVDPDVVPGKTYFYRVEEVDLSGVTQNFGPLEVQAQGGGIFELILAILLGGIGLAGLVYWLKRMRQKPE
jgi:hypothetical protein